MRILDIAQMLLLAALWGASFLFMRIAAPVLGPVWLIEFRVLLAGLVLLPMAIRSGFLREIRRKLPLFILVGCINSALPFSLFAFASLSLPAGFTSILNATVPLFSTIVASIWLKEKFTLSRAIGFILGFAGVVVVVGWKPISATPAFFFAVFAGLLAAFLYAIAAPYIKHKFAGISSSAIATGTLWGAGLVLIPILPFTVPQQTPSISAILATIALAVFSTACAYLLYFRLLKNIGPTKTLTVAYLIPLFAIFWGAIGLKETITESMIFGGGLILLGTAIANDLFSKWQPNKSKT